MTKLGIVKNFLKFKLDKLFGIIGCEKSNISYLPNKSGSLGTLCMVGFAEDVLIWNMNTNEIVETIHSTPNDKVTFVTYFKSDVSGFTVSIGYESGYVSVYSLWTMEKLIHLKCHRHSISYIHYCEPYGERIICGSKDTSITVLNIGEERGFELKGHVSPITRLHYIWRKDVLISSSQDGNIKLWTIGERHCFKTISNLAEVWDFHYCDKRQLLITGSNDSMLRLWKLQFATNSGADNDGTFNIDQSLAEAYSNLVQATFLGEVERKCSKRIVEMAVDEDGAYLTCNTATKQLEVYAIATDDELDKRLKKKAKKAAASTDDKSAPPPVIVATDRLRLTRLVDMPARCKSIATSCQTNKAGKLQLEILAAMHNNSVASMFVELPHGKELVVREQITQPGHRTAIIYVQMTSDGMGLFTVSLSEAKLWDKSSSKCIFTIGWSKKERARGSLHEEDFSRIYGQLNLGTHDNLEANCALLLRGDRHAMVGYKNGALIVWNLRDGEALQSLRPHKDTITSLLPSADASCVMSTSADTTLQSWKLEYGAKGTLQLVAAPELAATYNQGITCMAATPNGQLLAIAFLDNKVRTYLCTDLAKRILDLHGHAEPVTSLCVRHDSAQILSGSSDKTVRAWNLPFGDCKIFRGHRDPVTDVRYVPGRRSMAFSADKSGLIIQFDVANMTEILRLRGHWAQVTCLAIESPSAEADDAADDEPMEMGCAEIVSVSTDCSIRVWYESDEILSKEAEAMDELDREHERDEMVREQVIIPGAPTVTETNILTKKTLSTEQCADKLIEAIDIGSQMALDPNAPVTNAQMIAMGSKDAQLFLLETLRKIRSGDLEFVLAQLPQAILLPFMGQLSELLKRNREPQLVCRCLLFLGKMHFKYIKNSGDFIEIVDSVARHGPMALNNIRDLIGFNIEAFKFFTARFGPELVKFTDKRTMAKSKSKKNKK